MPRPPRLRSLPEPAPGLRLKVLLDADHDGTPEAQSVSRVLVFSKRSLASAQGTFSMPMLRDAVFTGKMQSVPRRLLISGNVKPALVAGESYYVEVISGASAGQRLELDEAAPAPASLPRKPAPCPMPWPACARRRPPALDAGWPVPA